LSEPTSPLAPESRQFASLLASKLYFYLGSLEEAVDAALLADSAFTRESPSVDLSKNTQAVKEYQDTIIAKCLDRAIRQRARSQEVDGRLSSIVQGVLEGSLGHAEMEVAGAAKLVSWNSTKYNVVFILYFSLSYSQSVLRSP
jgi:hypothetical protein